MTPSDLRNLLSQPDRLRALTQSIRAKIPAHDVEDLVQATLADALTAAEPPLEVGAIDRWLFGIARHKIADYYRRGRRHESLDSDTNHHELVADTGPESARDLLRWVHGELPKDSDAPRTLEWMMREASGDRLEAIAEEHELSAPAVRKRVSRLRRYLRERWVLEVAAALGLLVVITGIFAYRQRRVAPPITPEVVEQVPTDLQRARQLREIALRACQAGQWKACLDDLERAKGLDPAGDSAPVVQEARIGAAEAIRSMSLPAPGPSSSSNPPEPSREKAQENAPSPAPAPTEYRQPSPETIQKVQPKKAPITTKTQTRKVPPFTSKKNQQDPFSDIEQKSMK